MNANFSGANLKGTNFSGANLKGTNFSGANLRGAILSQANLRGANLRGAILSHANLSVSNLEDTNLENAVLRGANLEGANLEGANLEGANLEGANLEGAILFNTKNKFIYTFQVGRHFGYYCDGWVKLGCKVLSLQDWQKEYKSIGVQEFYDRKALELYGYILTVTIPALLKIKGETN